MSANVKNYNIKEIKIGLRKKYRSYRSGLTSFKKRLYDTSIKYNVLNLKEYKDNNTVFIFVSKDEEIDTYKIIQECWNSKKKVAVPRCIPNSRDMQFYQINSFEDLEKGTFGVMEPVMDRCRVVTEDRGLCIVPGLAFDAKGYRLGYGMGYYDRFLSAFKGATVGISYAECVQWDLPHGYFDRPVDILVTENYIRRIASVNENNKEG